MELDKKTAAGAASGLERTPRGTDPTIDAKSALMRLADLDGVWYGPVERIDSDGKVSKSTMTVRVGPMLDCTVRVLEERTYSADGRLAYHLLGVFFPNSHGDGCVLHAYAYGTVRSAAVHLFPGGFYFDMPGEGGATMRLTSHVANGDWQEIVERLASNQPAVTVRIVRLRRATTSEWPNGEFPSAGSLLKP